MRSRLATPASLLCSMEANIFQRPVKPPTTSPFYEVNKKTSRKVTQLFSEASWNNAVVVLLFFWGVFGVHINTFFDQTHAASKGLKGRFTAASQRRSMLCSELRRPARFRMDHFFGGKCWDGTIIQLLWDGHQKKHIYIMHHQSALIGHITMEKAVRLGQSPSVRCSWGVGRIFLPISTSLLHPFAWKNQTHLPQVPTIWDTKHPNRGTQVAQISMHHLRFLLHGFQLHAVHDGIGTCSWPSHLGAFKAI